jgi:hypothetical protein
VSIANLVLFVWMFFCLGLAPSLFCFAVVSSRLGFRQVDPLFSKDNGFALSNGLAWQENRQKGAKHHLKIEIQEM